jgi:acyl-CoA thioesterase-1
MVNVPVESLTDLKTCSTETIGELAASNDVEGLEETSTVPETTDSNMSDLSKNFRFTFSDCSKLGQAARNGWAKPLGALLLTALLGAPGLAQTQAEAKTQSPSPTLLIVGDSLSAEYGLKRGTGWVPLLEKQLASDKKKVRVVNASISGDTTSGGRSRLPALLAQHKPATVVIELGGNDALRGLPLDMTEKNLTAMTQASKKAGAKVLLIGMQVPPNYGSAYSAGFSDLFVKVAKAEKVALVPFFLKGIADGDDAATNFQADRIHPNEPSQARMLANVWPELKKIIP